MSIRAGRVPQPPLSSRRGTSHDLIGAAATPDGGSAVATRDGRGRGDTFVIQAPAGINPVAKGSENMVLGPGSVCEYTAERC